MAPELGEGVQAPGDVGAEVPGGQDSGRPALGDDSHLAVLDGQPSDRPAVVEPRSSVQRHDVDLPVLTEWQETPEDWERFGDQW